MVLTGEMARSARFELSAQVLHETIDGEVIVIDLGTGTYYSLRGTAAEVWGLVVRFPGVAASELAHVLAARYGNGTGDIEAAVAQFVSALHDEGLLQALNGTAPATTVEPSAASNGEPAGTFAPPVLEKYTDMQDLVLIDPVHEVSGAGWPHTAADATPNGSRA